MTSPWIIRLSAVVIHELRRGGRSRLENEFVEELIENVKIITPTERHWIESGEILASIGNKRGYNSNKIRTLAFDVLIALSARDSGSTLVTCNRDDFTEIQKHILFKAVYWS